MIPARDPDEFALLPAEDVAFVREWLQFADAHAPTLARTRAIATLGAPALGAVDGTAAIAREPGGEPGREGFVFLFNPNMAAKNDTDLVFDEVTGACSSLSLGDEA